MRITTSALIGIAVVGLLSGCGPSSSSSSSSGAAAGGSTPAASASGSPSSGLGSSGGGTATGCPTASAVSADLGISGLTTQLSKAETSQGHAGYACVYSAGISTVTVTLVNGVSSSYLSSAAQESQKVAKSVGGLKTVPGFADQSYSFSLSEPGVTVNELIARKGSVEAVVNSGATLAQEEALAQSLFTQAGA